MNKNLIKEFFRTVIFLAGYILCHKKKSRICYYHDVHSVKCYSPMSTDFELLKKHLAIIEKGGFKIVRTINQSMGEVQIAFDDGLKGIWDIKDFFISKQIYPTIFVAKKLVGEEDYLSEDMIIELDRIGFNIQSHAVSHDDLTQYNEEELLFELNESKHYLKGLLGKEVHSICLPIGYYSKLVYQKGVESGYKNIYLSIPGGYSDRLNDMPLAIPRIMIQSLSQLQLKLALWGGLDILRKHFIRLHFRE